MDGFGIGVNGFSSLPSAGVGFGIVLAILAALSAVSL